MVVGSTDMEMMTLLTGVNGRPTAKRKRPLVYKRPGVQGIGHACPLRLRGEASSASEWTMARSSDLSCMRGDEIGNCSLPVEDAIIRRGPSWPFRGAPLHHG